MLCYRRTQNQTRPQPQLSSTRRRGQGACRSLESYPPPQPPSSPAEAVRASTVVQPVLPTPPPPLPPPPPHPCHAPLSPLDPRSKVMATLGTGQERPEVSTPCRQDAPVRSYSISSSIIIMRVKSLSKSQVGAMFSFMDYSAQLNAFFLCMCTFMYCEHCYNNYSPKI